MYIVLSTVESTGKMQDSTKGQSTDTKKCQNYMVLRLKLNGKLRVQDSLLPYFHRMLALLSSLHEATFSLSPSFHYRRDYR
jgi:hypothetical protein